MPRWRLSEETRRKQSEAAKLAYKRPEVKEKHFRSIKIFWQRLGAREEHSKLMKTVLQRPEIKKKLSDSQRNIWRSPGFKERQSILLKAALQRPEVKEKRSKSMRAVWQKPGLKERWSILRKAVWQRPGAKEKQSRSQRATQQNMERRERQSRLAKALWQNSDFRLKVLQGRSKILLRANKIELLSQESLLKSGIPFLTNVPVDEICEADIVLPDNKIAIFCDGCYWHGCLDCGFNHPKARQRRGLDRKHNAQLRDRGWKVYRFWEHQIMQDPDIVSDTLKRDMRLSLYITKEVIHQ